MKATDAEIALKINALMDLLKWFREHTVKIHISPSESGWNLKFTVPETPFDSRTPITEKPEGLAEI